MKVAISCCTRPRAGQSGGSDRCGWWKTPSRIVLAEADGLQAISPMREALANPRSTGDDQAGSVLARWADANADANADAVVLIYRHEAAVLCQH